MCCSVLQCVLQRVAACVVVFCNESFSVLQTSLDLNLAGKSCVLQSVCCSALQRVAVHCSVLQRVTMRGAVCCKVLQRVL